MECREMDKEKVYESLKKDLDDGVLTSKGFDAKVKELLHQGEAHVNSTGAVEVFNRAKQLIKPQVKKCQFPLRKTGKSLLKVKMAPMEWKSRTKTKPGRYHKIILDEAPPRILLKGTEDYDGLVDIGKQTFWTGEQIEGSTFTLCHSDGTRWTKEQFHKEYGSVSDIPTPWKLSFYVGRREMEVICVGDDDMDSDQDFQPIRRRHVGRSADPGAGKSTDSGLGRIADSGRAAEEGTGISTSTDPGVGRATSGDPGAGISTSVDPGVGRATSGDPGAGRSGDPGAGRATSGDPGAGRATSGDPGAGRAMDGGTGTSIDAGAFGQNEVFYVSSNVVTMLPSLYLPRLPYVDQSLITYNPENLLGEGTFRKVYAGNFQGTPAAIKKISCGIAGMQDTDIQHEISISLQLSHPNIVRLMAAARLDHAFLLANEYVHGATLDDALHSDRSCIKLEGHDRHFIALDLSMAIEYIHNKNIIHQDLKPGNVLIDQFSKKALLADWGLANIGDTVLLRQGSRVTGGRVGPMGGTFLYMAPECLTQYEQAADTSDIWSLGATYLELFTNSVPWCVKNQKQLCGLMVAHTPPHALQHLPDTYWFVSHMLRYDAALRPSASFVVNSLKEVDGPDLKSRYGVQW